MLLTSITQNGFMTIRHSISLAICLSLIIYSAGLADDHTFFNARVSELTSSGHLVLSASFRSEADLDDWKAGGDCSDCEEVYYDAAEDAAHFHAIGISLPVQFSDVSKSGIDSGKVYVQYETKFNTAWSDIDHSGGVFINCKFVRARQDSISGRSDPRLFDFQLLMSGVVCRNSSNCPAGLPTIRSYDSGYDPLKDTSGCTDKQPGGDTKACFDNPDDTPYDAADHLASTSMPFLYLENVWTRTTFEIDMDNGRIRRWISDENNATTLVTADMGDDSLGFPFSPGSNIGLDAVRFGLNSSSPYPSNPTNYAYWHRNIIIAEDLTSGELTNLLSGQPGGDSQIDYYVDADASGGGAGTIGDPYNLADANSATFSAGDTVYFQKGDTFAGTFTIDDAGSLGSVITLDAYGSGDNPILRGLVLSGDYITAQNLTIDGNKTATYDLVSMDADNQTLDSLEIRNGLRDGVDIGGGLNPTIQSCTIHHLLNGFYGADPVQDAHGITGNVGSSTVTISNTTIYNVSGDSVQFDPDRLSDGATVNITGCTFYTAPLTEDFNGSCPNADAPTTEGWCTGNIPGENAVDTKIDNSSPYTQTMTWNINGLTAYGWTDLDISPSNRAALNLKENITATLNKLNIYNNEIGFRLRGGNGNADIIIKNAIIHDNDIGIRVEDELENLEIFNCTFGDNTNQYYETNQLGHTGFDLRNNAFLGTKDALFSDSSNISGSSADFNNSANDDYTLSPVSSFINHGETISGVIVDYAGTSRVAPYEVGAYEFGGNVSNNITFNNCIIK